MCQETIDPTDNASDPQPIAPQPQPTPTPSLQLSLCTSRFFSSSSPPSPTPRPAHSLPLTRAGAAAGGEGRAAAAPTPLLRGAPRPTVAAGLSAPAGSAPLHPPLTAQRGGRLRRPLPLAPRPPRAPSPRRAAPGGALRSPTPLRAGGGPGRDTLAHSGRPGAGVAARKGLGPRAVTRAGPFGPPGSWGVVG